MQLSCHFSYIFQSVRHVDCPQETSKHFEIVNFGCCFFCVNVKGQLGVPSGKLTWQWKMDLLKMYSLLKMGIFHCHVSLLEGTPNNVPMVFLGSQT